MSGKSIQKRSDPAVRFLRTVRDGKDDAHLFVEGPKAIDEMLSSGWAPLTVYCTTKTLPDANALRLAHQPPGFPIVSLSDDVMSFVSDVTTPPGLIAIARRRPPSTEPVKGARFDLVLHGLQLPQNVGALLRTAEAAGVTRVWLTKGTSDAFGPKAIRGSAGSVFRVPVDAGHTLSTVASRFREEGVAFVAASARGNEDYDCFDWRGPVALAVGAEGSGFTPAEEKMFTSLVRIPMKGAVESLNAAAAAAICLFESARQRRSGRT